MPEVSLMEELFHGVVTVLGIGIGGLAAWHFFPGEARTYGGYEYRQRFVMMVGSIAGLVFSDLVWRLLSWIVR